MNSIVLLPLLFFIIFPVSVSTWVMGASVTEKKYTKIIKDLEAKLLLATTIAQNDVITQIINANNGRHHRNLNRRMIKLMEELGEASEAYLNVTSEGNGKKLTWADVREELADTVIVAVDCALTPTPDQFEMTYEQIEAAFSSVIATKLAKWKDNRDTGKSSTDAE